MPITVRQHAANNGKPASIAFPAPTLAGSLVVIYEHIINGTDFASPPTDSGGNVYVDSGIGPLSEPGGASFIRIWYKLNAAVTQTLNNPDTVDILAMHAYEIVGAATKDNATSLTGTTGAGGTNAAGPVGPFTTTGADIVICGMVNDIGPDSVGTNVAWSSPDGDVSGFLQYFVQSSPGSITGFVSDGGGSDPYAVVMISFSPPASVTAAVPVSVGDTEFIWGGTDGMGD